MSRQKPKPQYRGRARLSDLQYSMLHGLIHEQNRVFSEQFAVTLNTTTFGSLLHRGLITYNRAAARFTVNDDGVRYHDDFTTADCGRRVTELQKGLVRFDGNDFYLTEDGMSLPEAEQIRIFAKVSALPLSIYVGRQSRQETSRAGNVRKMA